MNDLPGDLGGTHPLRHWLNRLKQAVAARTPLPAPGYDLAQSPKGFVLTPKPGRGVGRQKTLRVKSVTGEYLVCRTWDGTNEGASDINVAKPFNARRPATETIAGVVVNYTYTAGADALNGYRTAVGTGINETQVVVPYWIADGLIAVAEIDYSGVTVDGADLKLIEVSARCWAQI